MNVRGLGITYFQDTVKDMQMEKKNAAPNPLECVHILICLNHSRNTETTTHLRFYMCKEPWE